MRQRDISCWEIDPNRFWDLLPQSDLPFSMKLLEVKVLPVHLGRLSKNAMVSRSDLISPW